MRCGGAQGGAALQQRSRVRLPPAAPASHALRCFPPTHSRSPAPHTDEAQFSEFQNPTSEPSWDVALLALAEDSTAAYARLPAAPAPAKGEWLLQTAWDVPESTVL